MTEEKRIDMRGKACPQPVVETRKALFLPDTEKLSVLVDNPGSAENVKRMAASMGRAVDVKEDDDGNFVVVIVKDESVEAREPGGDEPCPTCEIGPAPPRVVVFIASNFFGEGEKELGSILMRAFIKTLKQLDPLPECIVFANSGVKLTTEGSDLVADIKDLESSGAQILSCGTCLDYYNLKGKLEVGYESNMYEIATALATADRLVRP
jgi:selenium metabolism protein YedF